MALICITLLLSGCAAQDNPSDAEIVAGDILSWQQREEQVFYPAEPLEVDIGHMLRTAGALGEKWEFVRDIEKWGVPNYIQTADESRQAMSGDCDDFAVLLYITLLEEGYPYDSMALMHFIVSADGEDKSHVALCAFPCGQEGEYYIFGQSFARTKDRFPDWIPYAGFTLDAYWFY